MKITSQWESLMPNFQRKVEHDAKLEFPDKWSFQTKTSSIESTDIFWNSNNTLSKKKNVK